MALDDRPPSAGRFARWAIVLVAPLVLAAAAMPWVLERVRTQRRAVAAALPLAGTTGIEPAAGAQEPPRRPEAPTTTQIEAAGAAEREAARLQQRGLERSTIYTPRQATTTAGGERVAPFQGFGLSVESKPAGARVLVQGQDVGETPIVTTVDCTPGQAVEVRVERRGFRAERREVRCRADALVELSFPLGR
jgi:hypothetical protein